MSVRVLQGDCLRVLPTLPSDSVDSIVTDPPYGLGFMGKEWDALPPGEDWARECLRVLKPGGHILAFGGTRTWHRLAVAIEDAGFEIRDSIAWMYGTGFPKSKDLGDGRGTALKPAFEPVVVGRKPFKGSLTENVSKGGAGALNIDDCRIVHASADDLSTSKKKNPGNLSGVTSGVYGGNRPQQRVNAEGRFPTNVILDESQAEALDEQAGTRQAGNHPGTRSGNRGDSVYGLGHNGTSGQNRPTEPGGASRFFYCAKAPKSERPVVDGVFHPTVKPLTLIRYLVRLVTPSQGIVLDTFAGSGTTVEACLLEGLSVIAIEDDPDYIPLIRTRIDRALSALVKELI